MKFTDLIKSTYAKEYNSLVLKSKSWFVDLMHRTMRATPALIVSGSQEKLDFIKPGKMFFFIYDPKGKATLPYYDMFPLVLPIEQYRDGFLGLNFHYLDPQLRAVLLDALRQNAYEDVLVTYRQIKGNAMARHCLKRYLYKHVQSRFSKIEPVDFEWVLYLPVEHFRKKSKTYVWNQLGS